MRHHHVRQNLARRTFRQRRLRRNGSIIKNNYISLNHKPFSTHQIVLAWTFVAGDCRASRVLRCVWPLAVTPPGPRSWNPALDDEAGQATEHVRWFLAHLSKSSEQGTALSGDGFSRCHCPEEKRKGLIFVQMTSGIDWPFMILGEWPIKIIPTLLIF